MLNMENKFANLSGRRPVGVPMIFVCKHLSSQSNFVIAKFWRPNEALAILALVSWKCEEKWTKEKIQQCCCVDVLYQESSLANFREMSLAIYRHNVNLKLTDASAYKFIFWIYDRKTCLMCICHGFDIYEINRAWYLLHNFFFKET